MWDFTNAAADTIFNLQILYDGVPQTLTIASRDAATARLVKGNTTVPTTVYADSLLLGSAARAQIIVQAPGPEVQNATLSTLAIDTGPLGDDDPIRDIAVIVLNASAAIPATTFPSNAHNGSDIILSVNPQDVQPMRNRTLYFSEVLQDPSDPNSPTTFYLTQDGSQPVAFYASEPAQITTWQGDVENWLVQNQAMETHVFHTHQLHFTVLESYNIDEYEYPLNQFLDTLLIPYWNGTGGYPAYLVQLNFTSVDVGEFIAHCHIAQHEDEGMTLPIRVLPAGAASS